MMKAARVLSLAFPPVCLAVGFVAVLRWAVAGVLPTAATAILAPATLLLLVAAVFRAGVAFGPLRTDERGLDRPLHRRHGFAVIAAGTVLLLPMLGGFSLVDPWETHYAEVAREMLERHDFVSPWWANEGFFMSKPVLTFWLEAASMKLFGVGTSPDAILVASDGTIQHPEWAVRFPAFALALVGAYVLYHGVSRTAGRRAGLLSGIALLTFPGYALLAHQAITDMPLVACTGASLGLLVRALDTDDAVLARNYPLVVGRRTIELHAGHLAGLTVAILVLPQVLGLLLSQVQIDGGSVHFVADRLASGSPHACGLPSQPPCKTQALAHPALSPAVIAAFVVPVVLFIATSLAEERRLGRLFAVGAWTFAAIATMAKGPAGLVVPAGAALVVLVAGRHEASGAPKGAPFGVVGAEPQDTLAGRFRRLLGTVARLEIGRGLVVAILLVAPWYVAVYARNGRGYLDELVLRHMLGRTLERLHDTNAGEDLGLVYFVKQLGWATFPWSGLVAAAFAALPFCEERSRRGLTRLVGAGAAVIAFVLLGVMRTKFHHYVFLMLPPCAIVVGLWLDERLGEADGEHRDRARNAHTMILVVLGATIALLVLRDLGVDGAARRFLHLFTYRYDRRWPTAASTTPLLGGAGLLAVVASVALAAVRQRRRVVVVFAGAAILFVGMLLDVTLARGAKDGGQRGVLEAYYAVAGPRPTRPLVAYQLNWKGENFYTANHLAIFVVSGEPMQKWLASERARGDRAFFFVTERGRVGTLRGELGARTKIEVLTTDDVSAEFALVRAELE